MVKYYKKSLAFLIFIKADIYHQFLKIIHVMSVLMLLIMAQDFPWL